MYICALCTIYAVYSSIQHFHAVHPELLYADDSTARVTTAVLYEYVRVSAHGMCRLGPSPEIDPIGGCHGYMVRVVYVHICMSCGRSALLERVAVEWMYTSTCVVTGAWSTLSQKGEALTRFEAGMRAGLAGDTRVSFMGGKRGRPLPEYATFARACLRSMNGFSTTVLCAAAAVVGAYH